MSPSSNLAVLPQEDFFPDSGLLTNPLAREALNGILQHPLDLEFIASLGGLEGELPRHWSMNPGPEMGLSVLWKAFVHGINALMAAQAMSNPFTLFTFRFSRAPKPKGFDHHLFLDGDGHLRNVQSHILQIPELRPRASGIWAQCRIIGMESEKAGEAATAEVAKVLQSPETRAVEALVAWQEKFDHIVKQLEARALHQLQADSMANMDAQVALRGMLGSLAASSAQLGAALKSHKNAHDESKPEFLTNVVRHATDTRQMLVDVPRLVMAASLNANGKLPSPILSAIQGQLRNELQKLDGIIGRQALPFLALRPMVTPVPAVLEASRIQPTASPTLSAEPIRAAPTVTVVSNNALQQEVTPAAPPPVVTTQTTVEQKPPEQPKQEVALPTEQPKQEKKEQSKPEIPIVVIAQKPEPERRIMPVLVASNAAPVPSTQQPPQLVLVAAAVEMLARPTPTPQPVVVSNTLPHVEPPRTVEVIFLRERVNQQPTHEIVKPTVDLPKIVPTENKKPDTKEGNPPEVWREKDKIMDRVINDKPHDTHDITDRSHHSPPLPLPPEREKIDETPTDRTPKPEPILPIWGGGGDVREPITPTPRDEPVVVAFKKEAMVATGCDPTNVNCPHCRTADAAAQAGAEQVGSMSRRRSPPQPTPESTAA